MSEISETFRLVRMAIWGETDGLLPSHDCFTHIGRAAETLKPTNQGVYEVIVTMRLLEVTIWGDMEEFPGLLRGAGCL